MALAVGQALAQVRNNIYFEISLTIILAYASFVVAEH